MIISVELEDDMVAVIDDMAKKDERNRSQMLRILLREALETRKGEKK